ncbi:MAG: paraquat-inducible protein A [Sulfurovum sp.]|nr:MAG: paraquat-inducible protein A [Sulfurovum sp.]
MLTDKELDNFIICKKCDTLHRKIPLHQGGKALCSKCNTLIYHRDDKMIEKTLALVITTIISLMVAFNFTIISININGLEQSLSLLSLFSVLLEHQQYVVGVMFLFLIVLFPLMMLSSIFFALFFITIKRYGYTVRRLLILLSHLKHWNMLDIFFISLLVAMVKLFDYAKIELGIAFIAFILTLGLELTITKNINFDELWRKYENTYGDNYDKE